MKTVLVTLPLRREHVEKLRDAGSDCRFVFTNAQGEESRAIDGELVQNAQIIIGNVAPELIAASPKLELLQLFSAGADPYIVPGVLAENTVLTNSTGAYGKAVSEHAFALTLMIMKKLMIYRDEQRQCRWKDHGMTASLSGARVLVIGLGNIGLSYARMVKAMGAHVTGVNRRGGTCPEEAEALYTEEKLDSLLPEADVVASFLPGNSHTKHLFDARRFSLMKPGAFFVNCGRGSAVDSSALLHALTEGPLAAAAVDVTEEEPLAEDNPLWKLDNLMITPHVAGWGHSPEILDRVVDIAAGNLKALLEGKALRNVVDFSTGYRI